jgi:type II secretion system protein H
MCKINRGYTLIELMVVLVIIALGTAAILLKTSSLSRDSDLDVFAKQVVLKLQQEHNRAVMSGHTIELDFQADKILCKSVKPENCFKPIMLPPSMNWSWTTHSQKEKSKLKLLFSPDGEITSFTLSLDAKSSKKIEIIGLTNGTILQHELKP